MNRTCAIHVVAGIIMLFIAWRAIWPPASPKIKWACFIGLIVLAVVQAWLSIRQSNDQKQQQNNLASMVMDIAKKVGKSKPVNFEASQHTRSHTAGNITTTSTSLVDMNFSRIGDLNILPGTPFLVQCHLRNYGPSSLALKVNNTLTRPIDVKEGVDAVTWYFGPETVQAQSDGLPQLVGERQDEIVTDILLSVATPAGTLTISDLDFSVYTLPR